MNIRQIIITGIAVVLTAAIMFCAGMHHAIAHMEITAHGSTAEIVLHENVYTHDIG